MRRLVDKIFVFVIFMCGWSVDLCIARARVYLQRAKNEIPSSVEEDHQTVVEYIGSKCWKKLVEMKKPAWNYREYLDEVELECLSSNEKFKFEVSLKLIISITTSVGASLFLIAIVLLVCAKNNDTTPQTLTDTHDISKDDEELEQCDSFHSALSVKHDTEDTNVQENDEDAAATDANLPPVEEVLQVAPPPPPATTDAKLPPPPPSATDAKLPPPPPLSSSAPSPQGPKPPPPPTNARAPLPPPMRGSKGPPPPPLKAGGQKSSTAQSCIQRTKLKPFFWDKVIASPAQSMVWDEIRAGSFQFNEDMIESLFGYNAEEKKSNDRRGQLSTSSTTVIHLIDSKKSQNLSILLKALNVTTKEVSDALMEGNELPIELLQTLLKMAPTTDEELKLRLFTGDMSQVSSAERFLKAIVDIPFAFKRMDCLLFMMTLKEEVSSLKESFLILEMASNKLKSSRLFLKLLEAVLKTGNRMNDGTYRGGAQAFKLDTLLKLSDVKGKDGKTTLLHFVMQEMIRSEGIKAVRAAQRNCSVSSIKSEDFSEVIVDSTENFEVLGFEVVSGLTTELEVIKKAAVVDSDALTSTVGKLGHSLLRIKYFLNREMRDLGEECRFYDVLKDFVKESEGEITWLLKEETRIMDVVKNTVDYFHGKSTREEGLKLFGIVRDFMILLDKICAEIQKKMNQTAKVSHNHQINSNTDSNSDASVSHPLDQKISPKDSDSNSNSNSQEKAVEEMRQKLFPTVEDTMSSSSSSSSSTTTSNDEASPSISSSSKETHKLVNLSESYSSENHQLNNTLISPSTNSTTSFDDET